MRGALLLWLNLRDFFLLDWRLGFCNWRRGGDATAAVCTGPFAKPSLSGVDTKFTLAMLGLSWHGCVSVSGKLLPFAEDYLENEDRGNYLWKSAEREQRPNSDNSRLNRLSTVSQMDSLLAQRRAGPPGGTRASGCAWGVTRASFGPLGRWLTAQVCGRHGAGHAPRCFLADWDAVCYSLELDGADHPGLSIYSVKPRRRENECKSREDQQIRYYCNAGSYAMDSLRWLNS